MISLQPYNAAAMTAVNPSCQRRGREREKERGVSMDDRYTEESWGKIVEYFRGPC